LLVFFFFFFFSLPALPPLQFPPAEPSTSPAPRIHVFLTHPRDGCYFQAFTCVYFVFLLAYRGIFCPTPETLSDIGTHWPSAVPRQIFLILPRFICVPSPWLSSSLVHFFSFQPLQIPTTARTFLYKGRHFCAFFRPMVAHLPALPLSVSLFSYVDVRFP